MMRTFFKPNLSQAGTKGLHTYARSKKLLMTSKQAPKAAWTSNASSHPSNSSPRCMNPRIFSSTPKQIPSTQVTDQGRFKYTAEIMVSKLFPAGFGWQLFSGFADSMGMAATSPGFALMTGLGDMTGVLMGHMLYKTIQKNVSTREINLVDEAQTATWLGTAALFAGSSWQPTVNFLHDTCQLGFTPTFVGTTAMCGSVFFGGLAVGRSLYSWMAKHNSKTIIQDAGLSLSIGSATAAFVCTDPSFQPDLLYSLTAPVFNITDSHSVLQGCAIAGSSTLTGFGIMNTVQSLALPRGANWMDGNNPYSQYPAVEVTDQVEENATVLPKMA